MTGPDEAGIVLDPAVAAAIEGQVAEVLRADGLRMRPEWGASGFPQTDWGVLLKKSPRAWVYLQRMITTWRLTEVLPEDDLAEDHPLYPARFCARGWCYDGWIPAVLAGLAWDGCEDSEPAGWKREAGTERRNSEPAPGVRQMPSALDSR